MKSRQKAATEEEKATLAAPMTPSLKRFSIKPPVMMPKATAGRFSIPGWMNKLINGWMDEKDRYTKKILKLKCLTDHNFTPKCSKNNEL